MTERPVALPPSRPRGPDAGALGWLRANLFNSWGNTLLTVLILWGLAVILPPLVRWGFLDSVMSGDAAACRAAAFAAVRADLSLQPAMSLLL